MTINPPSPRKSRPESFEMWIIRSKVLKRSAVVSHLNTKYNLSSPQESHEAPRQFTGAKILQQLHIFNLALVGKKMVQKHFESVDM